MKFADVPTTVSYKDILLRDDFCLSPSKYSQVHTVNNGKVEFKILSKLISLNNTPKIKISNNEVIYIEIGDVNIYNGSIEYKVIPQYKLPKSSIKISQYDILISKVRTYRGGIGIVTKNCDNIFSTSAFIVISDTIGIDKNYLYAILRSKFFIEQIQSFENRGMYPRLDNDTIDKVKIPIPTDTTIIDKVSILTQSLINKEIELKNKFYQINSLIEQELQDNQLANTFAYEMPSYNNLININRFDTGLYTKKFKEIEFLIENYKNGCNTIVEQGFYSIRGQNLAVSVIGKSIYSDSYKTNFYQLYLPTHIAEYGTVNKIIYFGNKKALIKLKNEDIIFGAEGFEKGRSFILLNQKGKLTTNYHGTILRHDSSDMPHKVFIKCMLDWFREKNIIDAYSVGGNGGSFSTMYWDRLKFPLFPKDKQIEISKLYYNSSDTYLEHIVNLDTKTFNDIDLEVNKKSGILDLDEQIKKIKSIIDFEIKNMIK